jgi:mono/diheme cytochrome c family protein
MTWQSGAVTQRGSLQWLPSQNLLFFEPFEPLNPDLVYDLVSSGSLVYDDGTELRFAPLSSAEVAALDKTEVLPERNRDTTASIVEVLASSCGSCHDGRVLHAFTPQSLFRQSESDVTRPLVEPGETARSVLVDRIVHTLPRRSGQSMPPPWSDVPAISDEEVRRIEAWILADCPDDI